MLQKLKKMQILWMIIFIMGICISGKGTMKAMASSALQLNTEYKVTELRNLASLQANEYYWFNDIEFPNSGRARVVFKNTRKQIIEECTLRGSGEIYYDGIENTRSQWFSVPQGKSNLRLIVSSSIYDVNKEARFILEYQPSSQYTGEVENNNTFDTANTIQPGLTYEGNLTPKDTDTYKFVMAQNGLAIISSSSLKDYNYILLYKIHRIS